jgi:hypothetical protein
VVLPRAGRRREPDQPLTTGRETRTRETNSVFDNPSAASSTIRARCANPADNNYGALHGRG